MLECLDLVVLMLFDVLFFMKITKYQPSHVNAHPSLLCSQNYTKTYKWWNYGEMLINK